MWEGYNMNIQEKKRMLERYRQIEKYIESLLEQRISLYSVSSSRITGMPHSTKSVDRLADAICEADIREKQFFDEQYSIAENERERIFLAVNNLSVVEEKQILVMRYITGMKWNDIAKKIGYEERQVFRIHNRALQHIELS